MRLNPIFSLAALGTNKKKKKLFTLLMTANSSLLRQSRWSAQAQATFRFVCFHSICNDAAAALKEYIPTTKSLGNFGEI
jgi:hypothetical protein